MRYDKEYNKTKNQEEARRTLCRRPEHVRRLGSIPDRFVFYYLESQRCAESLNMEMKNLARPR